MVFSLHSWFKENLISTLHGGANQNVHAENVKVQILPIPPLEEQRTIAARLDREIAKLDALIAKVRESIERLRKCRTALISAAVTGKIDVRDAEQREATE